MKKLKEMMLAVWRLWYMKYAIVVVAGVLIVGFLDENSVMSHLKNKRRISELREEIGDYNARYHRDQDQVRELERNPKAAERIARERYFMKADDEDVFVLSDER